MAKIGGKAEQLRQATFVGRTHEVDMFRSLLLGSGNSSINALMFFGIGGQGKTALLRQLYTMTQDARTPCAYLDPQVQAGVYDFLTTAHEQVHALIRCPRFEEGLKRHEAIEAKLIGHSELPRTVLQLFVRGTLSLVPGGQVVNELITTEHFDAAMSKIHGVVGRKDGDFWMRPEEELTDRLVEDLNQFAVSNRLVLFLDTYEQMGAYDDWLRERVLANLEEWALLVMAGRHSLEGKGWQQFRTVLRQEELQPLSALDADDYLQRRGVSESRLRQVLVDKADGYPLALTVLAEMASQAGAQDLARLPERQQVVPVLLKRLMQHVAKRLQTVLDVCAVLRVVNEESLAFLLDQPEARDVYEELLQLDFVKRSSGGGVTLHDTVWEALHEDLRLRSPRRFRALNERAAQYYQDALAGPGTDDRERHTLERLFHLVQADEEQGFVLVQETVDQLLRAQLVMRLRETLDQVERFDLQRPASTLWLQYYRACLADLDSRQPEAEEIYQRLADQDTGDARLRAYALCDLARIQARRDRVWQPGGFDLVRALVQTSNDLFHIDAKLVQNLQTLSGITMLQREWGASRGYLQSMLAYYESAGDRYGMARTYLNMQGHCALRGEWKGYLSAQQHGLAMLSGDYQESQLHADLLAHWAPALSWMGRCHEAERNLREALSVISRGGRRDAIGALRDLFVALAAQQKFTEASAVVAEYLPVFEEIARDNRYAALEGSTHLRWRALMKIQQGDFPAAEGLLLQVLSLLRQYNYEGSMGETWRWLGLTYELQHRWPEAAVEYARNAGKRLSGRLYHECAAITGLVRVTVALGDYAAVPALITAAEDLAQRHEYNDHLASLRLMQGHLAWEGRLQGSGSGPDSALESYQQALVYALRFNRFLLDEVLWGGGVPSPLRPILTVCLEHGDAGRRLLAQVRAWWQTGTNDVGSPRPDTISPLPEGIPLLEAELLARQREEGNGAPQQAVVDHLNAILL